jgi:hypothetical protein
MQLTWADKMRFEERRKILLRLLALKFGSLSEEATVRVQAIESPEELDACFDRVLFANSLAGMGLEGTGNVSNGGEQN